MPGGRPTKYKKEYADQAKELWDRNVAFNPATPNAPGPRIEAGPVTDSIFTGTLNEHLEALEEQEELDY